MAEIDIACLRSQDPALGDDPVRLETAALIDSADFRKPSWGSRVAGAVARLAPDTKTATDIRQATMTRSKGHSAQSRTGAGTRYLRRHTRTPPK